VTSAALATLHRRASRSAWHRWCLAALLLSVVCAQAMGFMHGTIHAFHADDRPAAHVAVPPAVSDAGSWSRAEHRSAAQDWIESLFPVHHEANDCRLFDGLAHQCLPLPASGFSPLLVPGALVGRVLVCTFVARPAALFDARGPPSC